jgi:hypothetical protein
MRRAAVPRKRVAAPRKRTRGKAAPADALAALGAAVGDDARAFEAAGLAERWASETHFSILFAGYVRLFVVAYQLAAELRAKRKTIVAADRSKQTREARRERSAKYKDAQKARIEAVGDWLVQATRGSGRFPTLTAAVTALVAAAEKAEAPRVPALGATQMRELVGELPASVVLGAVKPTKLMLSAVAQHQAQQKAFASMGALAEQLARTLDDAINYDKLMQSVAADVQAQQKAFAAMGAQLKQLAAFGLGVDQEQPFRSTRTPKR